jgi:hypothetical protein
MSNPITLDKKPCRALTDREAANVIGGTIGCLLQHTPAVTVLRAVQWWAEHPEVFGRIQAAHLDDLAAQVFQE